MINRRMRELLVSVLLGGALGVFTLGMALVMLTILRPSWPRAVLAAVARAEARSPAPDLGEPEPGSPLNPLPTDDPYEPPTPSPVPLPTVQGHCGGPAAMTIALLGMDTRGNDYDYRARTDAIILVRVNYANPSAAMFSIPRDLYVPLPNLEAQGIEQSRINTAYLYGEIYDVPGGGPAEFKQAIELNFGIRVDRYVLINFHAFTALVDAVGGIDVDVPEPIYDDRFPNDDDTGTLVFEMPAGRQHMDGATALRYARTRHQDDDYHRIKRQQQVLFALAERLVSPEVVPEIPALIAALQRAGRTDLSAGELASLACIGPQIDREKIEALAIDGTLIMPWETPGGGRVSIPNRDLIAPLVQEFLNTGTESAAHQP